MEARFLISARNDLAALRDHYRRTLPAEARVGQMHLFEALAAIKRNPEIGLPLPAPSGLRAFRVPFLPFALIYRVKGGRVEFLRLRRLDQSVRP